jgi:hypothetical protein
MTERHILPSHPDYKALNWLQMLIVYAKNPHMHYLSWFNTGVSLASAAQRFDDEASMIDLEDKLKTAQKKLLDKLE